MLPQAVRWPLYGEAAVKLGIRLWGDARDDAGVMRVCALTLPRTRCYTHARVATPQLRLTALHAVASVVLCWLPLWINFITSCTSDT